MQWYKPHQQSTSITHGSRRRRRSSSSKSRRQDATDKTHMNY